MTHQDIHTAIDAVAPFASQEAWDNSGWQVGDPDAQCTGVLTAVDATVEIIREAHRSGANLVVTHHPLIFRPIKRILPSQGRVEATLAEALRLGVSILSCHTPLDKAPHSGLSLELARKLGLTNITVLEGAGDFGAIGDLPDPIDPRELARRVKDVCHCAVARCSALPPAGTMINRLALCTGSAAEFMEQAIAAGAQAYISSDTKHNAFLDHADAIWHIDLGHYETESHSADLLAEAICHKFPNFAKNVRRATADVDPITYL